MKRNVKQNFKLLKTHKIFELIRNSKNINAFSNYIFRFEYCNRSTVILQSVNETNITFACLELLRILVSCELINLSVVPLLPGLRFSRPVGLLLRYSCGKFERLWGFGLQLELVFIFNSRSYNWCCFSRCCEFTGSP